MKRFTKMLALGLAAALVFGMSVQAAPSVDTSNVAVGTTENKEITAEAIKDMGAVSAALVTEDALEKLGKDYADGTKKVVVAGGFDLTIVDESIKGKDVTIAVEGVKAANDYKLFHFTDDFSKIIEVITPVVADGKITFKLNSASPFVLVDMGAKAVNPPANNTNNNNNNNNNQAQPQTTSPAVAPKTGETVPVAGVMALILMAGAVICAKKVRYNR